MFYVRREIKIRVLFKKKTSCTNSEGQMEEVCAPSNEAMYRTQ